MSFMTSTIATVSPAATRPPTSTKGGAPGEGARQNRPTDGDSTTVPGAGRGARRRARGRGRGAARRRRSRPAARGAAAGAGRLRRRAAERAARGRRRRRRRPAARRAAGRRPDRDRHLLPVAAVEGVEQRLHGPCRSTPCSRSHSSQAAGACAGRPSGGPCPVRRAVVPPTPAPRRAAADGRSCRVMDFEPSDRCHGLRRAPDRVHGRARVSRRGRSTRSSCARPATRTATRR